MITLYEQPKEVMLNMAFHGNNDLVGDFECGIKYQAIGEFECEDYGSDKAIIVFNGKDVHSFCSSLVEDWS